MSFMLVHAGKYRTEDKLQIQTIQTDTDTRSQAVARIADHTAKIVGVTWPRPRPLSGELFVRPLSIPHTKLHTGTKFEVSSSSSFRDIAL